jgi:hypothetical protein
MQVESDGTDFHITLTAHELSQVLRPTDTLGGFKYSYLEAHPLLQGGEEKEWSIGLWPSNDLSCHQAEDGITFEMDEVGPLFRVHPSKLLELLHGKIPNLGSRYDGSNKVFISLTNPTPV